MSRDWKFDMELCTKAKADGSNDAITNIVTDISLYWLQQYAAAKEEIARINCDYYADKQRFVVQRRELEESKAREQKLREAITLYISEDMYRDDAEPFFEELLTSLYPKEETKPAVLEEEEA